MSEGDGSIYLTFRFFFNVIQASRGCAAFLSNGTRIANIQEVRMKNAARYFGLLLLAGAIFVGITVSLH